MVMYNLQAASSPVEVSAQVCVAKNLLKSPHFPSMSPPPSSDLLLDECNGADLGGALPTGSTSSLFRPFHFPSFPSPPPSSSSILHPLASAKMKNCLSQETRFILWFYSISRNTRRTWDSFVSVPFSVVLPHLHFFLFLICIFMENMKWWHLEWFKLLFRKRGKNWRYITPHPLQIHTH